jgi:hypothetical protein
VSRFLVALTLLASACAMALTLDVDPTGGPLVLEERARTALDAWRDVGVDVGASTRRVRIVYGDPLLLGPDVPVLVRTSADPDVDLELLVHPDLVDRYPGALLYAIGVALGAEPGEGALARRQEPGVAVPPTPEQVAALASARAIDPADLDGDGVVGFGDLLILAERFGQRGVNVPGDLNGDGVVDATDVALLRERYTFEAPSATPPAAPAPPATTSPGAPRAPVPDLPPVPGPVGDQGEGDEVDTDERDADDGADHGEE